MLSSRENRFPVTEDVETKKIVFLSSTKNGQNIKLKFVQDRTKCFFGFMLNRSAILRSIYAPISDIIKCLYIFKIVLL